MTKKHWSERLGHPPAGAASRPQPQHDPRARSGKSGDLVDLSPLAEPVNVFGFTAQMLRSHPAPPNPNDRQLWQQQIQWLEQLAEMIPYQSNHPVICMAMGRAACIGEERLHMMAALEALEETFGGYGGEEPRAEGG